MTQWYDSHAGDFALIAGSNIIVASIGQTFTTQLMSQADEVCTGDSLRSMVRRLRKVTQPRYADENYFIAFNRTDPNVVYAGNKISKDREHIFGQLISDHFRQ